MGDFTKSAFLFLASAKNYLFEIAVSVSAIFLPIKGVILTVGVLIAADLLTGIIAAKKRKEEISSAAMRRTVTKLFVYQIAILTGFLMEVYILDSIMPVAKLVAGVIGMVEFKSLLENVTDITGVDFKKVVEKLGSDNDSKQ